MADPGYATSNFLFQSKGIVARPVDDTIPEGNYLSMTSLEEIEEGGLASRLGSTLITATGGLCYPLAGGYTHSLARLGSLNGANFRYGGAGGNLYRRSDLFPGAYTLISNTLSGDPWTWISYTASFSSYPYIYIADMNGMLKDNGTFSAPQQMGIFQPQYPVVAQAQDPDEIILDSFRASAYSTVGVGSFSPNSTLIAANATSAILAPGIQAISLGQTPNPAALYQSWVVDTGGANEETVLVLQVTATGFIANFTKTHAVGALCTEFGLSGTVAASTVASISRSFGGTPITAWPVTLDQEDYIALQLYVSDPNAIQSITLKFDCGDGSFTGDFFWRTIGQGPFQSALNTTTDSSTAAADALLSNTLGIYGASAGGVSGLNTGQNQWTSILAQLSDFSSTGRADFNDPIYNWQAVRGYQIEIVTNDADNSILIEAASLVLVGGAGPDSFAGVGYDYMFTFYNNVDGTESNPSMAMTNVNPPSQTNWVVPRRQPVLLTMTHPVLDPQTTSLRVYRRGGTLADNYRRLDEIPCSGGVTTYTDILSDLQIQQSDTISFINDVPVTSTLPNPVNSTLADAITTTNTNINVYPASMANISVAQQVSLGDVTATNFETVIVGSVAADHFTAFVQNTHAIGETVSATAKYGQPVNIIAQAFDQTYFAGDPNNPSYLYYTPKGNPQTLSSAGYVVVSTPDDPITAIVNTGGNLFVSTLKKWWSIAPGSNQNSTPSVYPTMVDHGCLSPQAWTLRDGVVYYQSLDGLRAFIAGRSDYISGMIEFIFQGVGTTPIVEADQTQLAATQVSWWQKFVFFSYIGTDGARHRIVLDVENKRYRNDSVDAQCMLFEDASNVLLYGDSLGNIHQDRVNVAYDETDVAGAVVQAPIAFNLQTPYANQGAPVAQKNYQNLTIDANTNGIPVTATLLFNDGQTSQVIGTVTTKTRQRFNLNIADGDGLEGYKVSLQLTGAGTKRVFLYQCAIRYVVLAQTRQSYDTFYRRFGVDQSKVAKNCYLEYSATSPVLCEVYYDDQPTPGFTFTLPVVGVRKAYRQRLPAVKFRLLRMIMTCPSDFMLWNESSFYIKPLQQGSGYETFPLLSPEN